MKQTYEEHVRAIADGLGKCVKFHKYKWYGIYNCEIAEAKNRFFIMNDTCYFELTGGHIASFDIEKFDEFRVHRWCYASTDKSGKGYVCTWLGGKIVKMHHRVLGRYADHIDRDRMNNRRDNLRFVSHSDNASNVDRYTGSKNKYKGVYSRKNGTFYAQIIFKGKLMYLGSFRDPVSAAMKYDSRLIELRGNKATTNAKLGRFPDQEPPKESAFEKAIRESIERNDGQEDGEDGQ